MNRSPTDSTARFSPLSPPPIHPMQARRVGGWQGGSAVTIWAATTRGHRLVAAEGEEVPRRQRPREVSTTFLDHLLAITEVRTGIEEAVRQERAIAHSTGLLRDLFRVIRLDQLPTLIHGGPAAIPTPQASNQVG